MSRSSTNDATSAGGTDPASSSITSSSKRPETYKLKYSQRRRMHRNLLGGHDGGRFRRLLSSVGIRGRLPPRRRSLAATRFTPPCTFAGGFGRAVEAEARRGERFMSRARMAPSSIRTRSGTGKGKMQPSTPRPRLQACHAFSRGLGLSVCGAAEREVALGAQCAKADASRVHRPWKWALSPAHPLA